MGVIRERWRAYENEQLLLRAQALGLGGGGGAAPYDATKAYKAGEQAVAGGHIWRALVATTGTAPVEGATWTRLLSGVTAADATDAELSAAIAGLPAPRKRTWQFSHKGALAVATGTHRLYNDTGAAITLGKVRGAVGTAPAGAGIQFTLQSSQLGGMTSPVIAAGANDSGLATPSPTTWSDGTYLTVNINSVGSTTAGSDLVVTLTEA